MKPHRPEIHSRTWGDEVWIANNDKYCGKILRVRPGESCSLQYHKEKDETWFVLKGKISVELWPDKSFIMLEGDIVDIHHGTIHKFTAVDGLAEIIEVSTHHEYSDTYKVDK